VLQLCNVLPQTTVGWKFSLVVMHYYIVLDQQTYSVLEPG